MRWAKRVVMGCDLESMSLLRTAGTHPALFWTPYADWIDTVVSTGGLLLIIWLALRPRT